MKIGRNLTYHFKSFRKTPALPIVWVYVLTMSRNSFDILPRPASWGAVLAAFRPRFEAAGIRPMHANLNKPGKTLYPTTHVKQLLLNLKHASRDTLVDPWVHGEKGNADPDPALEKCKALHGRLKSQRDGTGGKLTVDPPFSFRRERGTDKI